VYEPFVRLTFQVVICVRAIGVAMLTPGPDRWKLWKVAVSLTEIE
jgi:hypothetical protein